MTAPARKLGTELTAILIQAQLLEDSLARGEIPQAIEGVAQMREGVQESYDDVRELLVHFRTRLDHADIELAIASALDKFEGQTGIATPFRHSGSGIPLPPEHEIQVLHIVQEALSNVRKHSGAHRVEVEMRRARDYVFSIRDDDRGFDRSVLEDETDTHVGLQIMREREILALLARGASNKEIARELDVSESTVKIHVQHILRKLGLTSRVQAAVYAVENGLAGM